MWNFYELSRSEYFTSTFNILNNFSDESSEQRKDNLKYSMYLKLFTWS